MLNQSSYTTCAVQGQTLSSVAVVLVAPSRKVLELLNALGFTNVAPHWAPKSVTNITLYLLSMVLLSLVSSCSIQASSSRG